MNDNEIGLRLSVEFARKVAEYDPQATNDLRRTLSELVHAAQEREATSATGETAS